MCRLAYITERFQGLEPWLEQMDKSCGGDGIGVATQGRCRKGMHMTVRSSFALIMRSAKPVLWHTRRVSSGKKATSLCHPFPCAGGWMVHNGHWTEGHQTAEVLQDLGYGSLSDTAVFAQLITKLGLRKATENYAPTGVWLWMDRKHRLSVYKNGGSLYYSPNLGAWGSEPDEDNTWIQVANGFYGPRDRIVEKREPAPVWIPDSRYAGHPEYYIDVSTGAIRLR